MKLTEIVNQLYVSLMGDRVNLASKITLAAGIYGLIRYKDPLLLIPTGLGLIFFVYTTEGLGTLKYYNRTSKHIKQFGKLDSEFAKTLIEGTENRKFTGYCQIQGMYLAAKKYGQLDAFYEAKKKYSKNIIPNF